jgi:hypothetical protein
MTPPLPPIATRSPGRVQTRVADALFIWKRTEPARLYLYGLTAAVVLVLAVVGAVTQDLAAALTGLAAALLVGVPGAAAVRASVYSPATRAQDRLDDSTRYAALIRQGQAQQAEWNEVRP